MQRVYEDFDLHIGYRVHAHLYFLSRRIPSILLSEDVRGSGQAKSLGMEEIRVGDATAMERLHRELDAVEAGCAPQKAAVERMRENFGVMQKFLENA